MSADCVPRIGQGVKRGGHERRRLPHAPPPELTGRRLAGGRSLTAPRARTPVGLSRAVGFEAHAHDSPARKPHRHSGSSASTCSHSRAIRSVSSASSRYACSRRRSSSRARYASIASQTTALALGQQFPLSPKVPVESPRSGAQTAEKVAKFRLHHHVQDVSGNCWRWESIAGTARSRPEATLSAAFWPPT